MLIAKKLLFLFLIVSLPVCFVFAGGKQEAAEEEETGEISVWKLGGAPKEVEHWPVANEKFEKEYPNIKLKYSYFYGQIRRQKIIGGFQTKNLADVIIAFGQDIPDFAGLNIIQPLDEIDSKMVDSWKEHIVPEVWDTGLYQDKVYALPTYVDMASFLAYNVDFFEEAGLKGPPENWTELKEYAAKLTKPDRPGIALQATLAPVDVNIFEGVAYSNGGRFLDEEKGKIAINGPGFVDALKLYDDLIKGGYTNKGLTESRFWEAAHLFGEQKVAMWVGLSWLASPWFPCDPKEFRWEGTLFPRPDNPTGKFQTVATLMDPTAALMITTLSKSPKAALTYVDFWAQPEQLSFWDGSGEVCRVPGYKGAYDSPDLKRIWPEWVKLYKAGELFKGSQPMPRFVGLSEAENDLAKAIQTVVLGQKDPQTALDEAAKKAQDLYDILHE
ncbi:MAG: extracellular solute-binding protein [Spirochaetes bacterium]|nr:extracellular solute-binding protein [Spirochaetota bacterium]